MVRPEINYQSHQISVYRPGIPPVLIDPDEAFEALESVEYVPILTNGNGGVREIPTETPFMLERGVNILEFLTNATQHPAGEPCRTDIYPQVEACIQTIDQTPYAVCITPLNQHKRREVNGFKVKCYQLQESYSRSRGFYFLQPYLMPVATGKHK